MKPARNHVRRRHWPVLLAALPMLLVFILPVLALILTSSFSDVLAGIQHPLFAHALWLSTRTSLVSLSLVIVCGTPLAWWLAASSGRHVKALEICIDIPIVLPPAVVGIALLQTFGRNGLFGEPLSALNIQVPFTSVAVVIAQVAVSAPFYIQGATEAFRRVDSDLLIVARSLGQSPWGAFFRVALPLALPGLVGGAAISWARSLGEFGATLLFAGNLPGVTQTMPLAVFMTLESDVRIALAIAIVLAAVSVFLLFLFRLFPSTWSRRQTEAGGGACGTAEGGYP